MRYYLDFDRTLFDTDRFAVWLRARVPGGETLSHAELCAAAMHEIYEERITFAPGELAEFLFPDAAAFLREKENAATIVTYGPKDFQEAKVKSALHGIPRTAVMYTGEVRKGAFLAPHTHLHAGAILVDDSALELEILAEQCPDLKLFEMRRDGGKGDGRWEVVHALKELP